MTLPPDSSRVKPTIRWRILALLMALCFISHFNRASMASAGDERIMKQFGISTEQMGVVYSAFLVVYTVFMIPGGFFIDRFGPRIALAGMGIGTAVFCAFTGMVGLGFIAAGQVWLSLLIVRSLMGLLTTPLHPASARAVANWFPLQQRALANDAGAGSTGFGHLLRNRSLLLLTLSYAAVGYFQYLFFYWMHYYFDEVVHMGKTESRFYSGMPNLAMAICMPLGGWLTDKAQKLLGQTTGRTLVPRIGMAASAALLLFGIFATQPFWIVLWFTLSLGILGLCEGAFWTTAVELGGTRGGTAAAIMNTGGNGIGLLAPVVTPWVSAKLGWVWGIGLGAFVALAGAVCWFWIEPRRGAP